MEIITPEQDKQITQYSQPSQLAEWLAGLSDLSAVTPEVALNKPLAELVEMTLTAAAGDSTHTARAYETGIGLFLQWLGQDLGDRLPREWRPLARPGKAEHTDTRGRHYTSTVWEFRGLAAVLRAVAPGSLDNYTAWRSMQGDGKQTRSLRRQAVTTFLRVAMRENVLTIEQVQAMGLKPYRKRERRDVQPVGRRLGREEVRALRLAIESQIKNGSTAKATRDRALIDCMLYAALRMAEVAGLTPGSLRQDGGRWWVVLTGKGGKTRRVKCHDSLYKSLAAWASCAGVKLGEGDEPLFRNFRKGGAMNGPLTLSIVSELVAEYGTAAGLAPRAGENRLSPHDLRRTAARNAYDNGATIYQVQTMLGHSDPKTTIRYIGSLENDDSTAIDHVNYG